MLKQRVLAQDCTARLSDGCGVRLSDGRHHLRTSPCAAALENRERVGVSIHQDCASSIIAPFVDCDTVGSEWIDQEEGGQQARRCMSARTKQTMRFCTRHRGKSPIACSLEPCANVHMRILSQQDRDTGRNNKQLLD